MWDALIEKIKNSYESGVTQLEAEKLAAEFLHAQLELAKELQDADLDSRMRKSGLKALRSGLRLEETKKHEKKPTEGALEDLVNTNKIAQDEQDALDSAEVKVETLERYYAIFKEAHIYYRGIGKGAYSG